MVRQVRFLVSVEEIADGSAKRGRGGSVAAEAPAAEEKE
jgi:hypothetical protein